MGLERRELGGGGDVPELDVAHRVSRDNRPIPQDTDAPDNAPRRSRLGRALGLKFLLLDDHALDDAARLEVPLAETRVGAARHKPVVLPRLDLVLLVVIFGTFAVAAGLFGSRSLWLRRRGRSPGDGKQSGFRPLEAALMREVLIVEE